MKGKIREYDEERKRNTLNKLNKGFAELKKKNPKLPVTKYALSKHTGIARQTISNYPEIVEKLKKEEDLKYHIKTSVGVRSIRTIEDIKPLVDEFESLLKEKDDKYNKLFQENTRLNLEIVKLADENRKLKQINERYEKVVRDGEQKE